jgi:beta-carotene 15,15'-monooxygenase
MAEGTTDGDEDVDGFHSIREERHERVDVEGTLPDWLSGTLVRNGPGSFRTGPEEVDHWFDGLAMLRAFSFDGPDGAVIYRNRFLDTRTRRRALAGRFDGGFATGDGGPLDALRALVFAEPYDNANVIAERIGDEYVTLTETPAWVEFDPETLATGVHVGADASAGQLACAHLHHDPWTGETLGFETAFGRQCRYHVYAAETPTDRRTVATVPVEEPAYMHSFGATRRYVVLTEFPYVVDPVDLLTGEGSFVDAFRWEPERGLRFRVIDRRGGGLVGTATAEGRFGFHHVNAYERGNDELVLDVETVPDGDVSVGALYLDELRRGELNVPAGAVDRYRLSLSATGPAVERERRYEGGTALPTVSPAVRMCEHRYVYAQGCDQPVTDWPGRITKLDVETGTVQEWSADGSPGEPVFVPRPDRESDDPWTLGAPEREDRGVVLTVVLDPDARASRLVVLDGETLDERARAPLPHPLPFDFHGRFFPEVELRAR